MKELGQFLLGVLLVIVGVVIFLQNITVGSFSLFSYNRIPVGGILIILLAVSFIVLLIKPKVYTGVVFGLLLLVFFVVLILSLNISVNRMSALELFLIIGTFCVGAALTIKSLFGMKSLDDKNRKNK